MAQCDRLYRTAKDTAVYQIRFAVSGNHLGIGVYISSTCDGSNSAGGIKSGEKVLHLRHPRVQDLAF